MNLKTLSKMLMGLGVLLLIYGVTMDTSVSLGGYYGRRVINVGLANDRLMFILLGGFAFIGGIIIYSNLKERRKDGGENADPFQDQSKHAENGSEERDFLYEYVAKDFIFKRLVHAVGVAFVVTLAANFTMRLPGNLIMIYHGLMIYLVFRPIYYYKAISQGWMVASVLMLLASLKMFVQGFSIMEYNYNLPMYLAEWLFVGLYLILACIFYIGHKKFEKSALNNI